MSLQLACLHRLYEPRCAAVLSMAPELIARREAGDCRSRDISDLALPEASRLVDAFHISTDSRPGYNIGADEVVDVKRVTQEAQC